MAGVRYIDGSELKAWKKPGDVALRITLLEDRSLLNSRMKRVFPLSKPQEYLSIQDGEGKEVAVLRSLSELDQDSRKVIEEELDRRYFTPQITKIHRLRQEAGMWRFEVETTRGPSEFYVRNWRDSAFELVPGRWQITSVDGVRFEIAKLEDLDDASQKHMDALL